MKAIFQLAVVLFAFAPLAYAQSSSDGSLELSIDEVTLSETMDPRFKLFMGVGLGYTDNSDDLYTEGYPKQFKVDGSYSTTDYPLVFDLGLGMSNQNFTKSNKPTASGLLFEAAGRYKWDEGYQVGPVLHTLINQGDNFHASSNNAIFLGVQAMKEFAAFDGRYNIRLGAKLMTDVNISGDIINIGMLEAAIGFPIFKQTLVTETGSMDFEPLSPHDTELVPMPAINSVKRDLRAETMTFNLNEVKENQHIFTKHLDRTLKNNPHLYGRVEKRGNKLVFYKVTNEVALKELLKSVQ